MSLASSAISLPVLYATPVFIFFTLLDRSSIFSVWILILDVFAEISLERASVLLISLSREDFASVREFKRAESSFFLEIISDESLDSNFSILLLLVVAVFLRSPTAFSAAAFAVAFTDASILLKISSWISSLSKFIFSEMNFKIRG